MRLAIDASHVIDNPAEHRFELPLDVGETAVAYYRIEGNVVYFLHPEVPQRFSGQGIGSALATRSLELIRKSGRRVIANCPFTAAILALRRAALTVLLNQVAPEDLAAPERVAETIAAAPLEDALSALSTCRFCDEAAVSIVRWRSSAFLNPRQFDRHGVRLLFGQNTRDCK
jgi:uncharacterized protein